MSASESSRSRSILIIVGLSAWVVGGSSGARADLKIIAGTDAGTTDSVKVYDVPSYSTPHNFVPYPASGGVRVALGDVNNDGVPDVLTAPGPGSAPQVQVYDGTSGDGIYNFNAYDPGFTGGVFVAAGDINHDGHTDIITGADGSTAHVRVFDGTNLSELRSFFAFDPAFTGGVRVAAGDVNNDGNADIITGAGPGGGPVVRVFDGKTQTMTRDFFAYGANFSGGVYVAAGDVNGDGYADIITGPGAGGLPNVEVFDGSTGNMIRSFLAYSANFSGGVRVGAADINGDGLADIITGPGAGGLPNLEVFSGADSSLLKSIVAFPINFDGGIFVGGTQPIPEPVAGTLVLAASTLLMRRRTNSHNSTAPNPS